jgi:hypothetical protein
LYDVTNCSRSCCSCGSAKLYTIYVGAQKPSKNSPLWPQLTWGYIQAQCLLLCYSKADKLLALDHWHHYWIHAILCGQTHDVMQLPWMHLFINECLVVSCTTSLSLNSQDYFQ